MVCAGVQGGGTDSCEVRAERGHSSGGGEGTRTVLGVGVDLDLFAWGQVERTLGSAASRSVMVITFAPP
jgi:hypothetical protein